MIRDSVVPWILGCVLLAIPALGQPTTGVEVTFLANEGFLLTAEEGSILIDAFVAADKDFDLLVFPGERHGYRSPKARRYAYRRVIDYFVENL